LFRFFFHWREGFARRILSESRPNLTYNRVNAFIVSVGGLFCSLASLYRPLLSIFLFVLKLFSTGFIHVVDQLFIRPIECLLVSAELIHLHFMLPLIIIAFLNKSVVSIVQ
jgi:hypothetical protein